MSYFFLNNMEPSHQLLLGTSDSDDNRNEKKPITRHKRFDRSSSATCSSSVGDCSFSSSGEATEEEEDMANCLILLARGTRHVSLRRDVSAVDAYDCKTCNRTFPSFQALGGHRASHKKPRIEERDRKTKPNSAVPKEPFEEDRQRIHRHDNHQNDVLVFDNKRNSPGTTSKVHECSVCGSEFTSGQALGGHMRRHRAAMPPSVASFGDAMTTTPSLLHSEDNDVMKRRRNNILPLDLNLPAPENDVHRSSSEMKFGFVFSATPALVDCHY